MSQITYLDKDKLAIDGIRNKWRDVDANEVKAAVNSKADADIEAALVYAATLSMDYTTGNVRQLTLTGDCALTITNLPVGGNGVIYVTGNGHSLTIDGQTVELNATGETQVVYTNNFSTLRIKTDSGTSLTALGTPTVSFGTSTETQNVVNWTAVTNATSYTVKRNTTNTQTGATTIYTGALLTYTDTGLTAATTYYYFVIATGAGYANSSAGTGSKATAAGASAEALVFSPTVGLTESPTGVYTGTTGSGGDYLNKGLATKSLAASTDGYIKFQYAGTNHKAAAIGFMEVNSNNNYGFYKAGIYVEANGVIAKLTEGTQTYVTGNPPAVVGDWLRVRRSGSSFLIERSADDVTYTTLETSTYVSTARMYIGINIDKDAKMTSPKGFNIS